MIPAYDKSYLLCAQKSLGRMLDFACHELGFEATDIWRHFLSSGVADGFGAGESHLLAGMSGIELAYEVLDRAGVAYSRVDNPVCADAKTPEYWAGWALAYYQWSSGLRFAEIGVFAPIDLVVDKYHPFHEMDIRQFVDEVERLRTESTTNALDQVRARVDARIAARIEELETRCCMMMAPAEDTRRGRSFDAPHRMAMTSARLPDDLKVPPVEPRPPNLHAANLSFAARLVIAVRDKFGGDAPRVYTAANLSRQAYSQIVSDETRPVSKRTAVRFAFALKSTPGEARLLLKSAGYAFSNSQTEDFILQACLEVDPPIWDLTAVNQLLREYRVDFQY